MPVMGKCGPDDVLHGAVLLALPAHHLVRLLLHTSRELGLEVFSRALSVVCVERGPLVHAEHGVHLCQIVLGQQLGAVWRPVNPEAAPPRERPAAIGLVCGGGEVCDEHCEHDRCVGSTGE
eukprot:scaffold47288_cov71-Phaeocystis_antarctica.AAC.1